MPRFEQEVRTTPPVLDRLLDESPGRPDPTHLDWHQQIRALKGSVARDLEYLLNTRQQAAPDLPEEFVEVGRSLLAYGLPDFSSLDLTGPEDCLKVKRAIESAIARFEPRLERVRVQMDEARNVDRGLRFRIEALLRVEPTPEPVSFDAVLQPATQECQVTGQH